jgi:hypothetical protein
MMVAPSKMHNLSAALHHRQIVGLKEGIDEKSLFVNRFFVHCTIFLKCGPDALAMHPGCIGNASGLH